MRPADTLGTTSTGITYEQHIRVANVEAKLGAGSDEDVVWTEAPAWQRLDEVVRLCVCDEHVLHHQAGGACRHEAAGGEAAEHVARECKHARLVEGRPAPHAGAELPAKPRLGYSEITPPDGCEISHCRCAFKSTPMHLGPVYICRELVCVQGTELVASFNCCFSSGTSGTLLSANQQVDGAHAEVHCKTTQSILHAVS